MRLKMHSKSSATLPSGFEKPLKTLSHWLMRKVFAAFQGFFAKLYGFDETGLFFQIPGEDVLDEIVGVAALLGS
jgi:hypothetical protein